MKKELEALRAEAQKSIQQIANKKKLEELEVVLFGRKGKLTHALKGIKDAAIEERKELGKFANTIKEELAGLFDKKKQELEAVVFENLAREEWADMTQPPIPPVQHGHLHPVTLVTQELEELFSSLGFLVQDGPQLESDFYNFEGLNFPAWHPSRDMQDTFYIQDNPEWLMRTHTSNMQVRLMQEHGAPLRAIIPGRVFRNEATDATHEHTFYQVEGIMIDTDISVAHLIAVMQEFLRGIFKRDVDVRVRPGHFPFTEPSFEFDLSFKSGVGPVPRDTAGAQWLEIVGAGMVHPNVLIAGGVDPQKYSGFAFGFGLTRLVMMRYGIEDIRLLQSGDMKFLTQF